MTTKEQQERLAWAIKQANGIAALEGFEPTELSRRIDAAVMSGRVDLMTVDKEMNEWVQQHKTLDGFLESRSWA